MIFKETELQGAFIIEPERFEDERGFFARTWSEKEFVARGLSGKVAECNRSYNKKKGTLRGMHYQVAPYAQVKTVCCTAGAIYDVIVDLRESSVTFKKWIAVELSAGNCLMLYIPDGLAHGFQTLEDNTEIFYQMSESYCPESARTVRWDDPALGINWPLDVSVISEKDRTHPFVDAAKKELS